MTDNLCYALRCLFFLSCIVFSSAFLSHRVSLTAVLFQLCFYTFLYVLSTAVSDVLTRVVGGIFTMHVSWLIIAVWLTFGLTLVRCLPKP